MNYNDSLFIDDSQIVIFGHEYRVVHSGNIRGTSRLCEDKIIISGLEEHSFLKIRSLLKKILYTEIWHMSLMYAVKLNVSFNKISIKLNKSNWGSCSNKKNLVFNLRLIFCPYNIVEYVVVHELCHLIEMNHSKKFWKLVGSLLHNYEAANNYLKLNGKRIFNYKI